MRIIVVLNCILLQYHVNSGTKIRLNDHIRNFYVTIYVSLSNTFYLGTVASEDS